MKKTLFIYGFMMFFSTTMAQSGFQKVLLLQKNNSPLICGHRGGWYDSIPENSMAVFSYSLSKSCSVLMMELDVRESKDGTLFVMHDETIDRTTNGTGQIAELKDDYLKSLFLKNKKGEVTAEKIPEFSKVLYWAKNQKVYLIIDLKSENIPKIINEIKQAHVTEKCLILTFKPQISQLVYQTNPNALISVLVKDETDWEAILKTKIPAKNLAAYIHINSSISLIDKLQALKIPVLTDVSENTKNRLTPFGRNYYVELAKEKKLNLLITDYPVEISRFFCEKP